MRGSRSISLSGKSAAVKVQRPGIAELIGRMVTGRTTEDDQVVLEEFSPYREFEQMEALK